MIKINSAISIPEDEVTITASRSSGPGGQNVNKVATAVQLRFNADRSIVLDENVKKRLRRLAGRRMSADGEIMIEAKRYREQEKNRADARERLAILIRTALERPRMRRQTRPTRSSVTRRIESKKKRGNVKQMRGKPAIED